MVEPDSSTGTPRLIARRDGFLTGPSNHRPRQVALDYVRRQSAAFALDGDDLAALELTRRYTSDSGATLALRARRRALPRARSQLRGLRRRRLRSATDRRDRPHDAARRAKPPRLRFPARIEQPRTRPLAVRALVAAAVIALAAGLGLLGNSLGGSPRAPQPASPEIAFLPLSIDRQVKGLPQAPMPKQRVAPSGRLTTVV